MKIRKLNCPNCNGTLDMDIAKGTTSVFCPYCGQRVYLDDGKREYTVNKNININETVHKRYTNDAEVIKANNAEKENKRSWIAAIVIFALALCALATPAIVIGINESIATNDGKISAGWYKDLLGQDYKTVEAHFEAAGFTNIQLIDLNDAGIAFWNDGKVETISIGGDTSFDSTDFYDPDTKVVISYH